MKDPIVKAHPEVLGILLNSTCARYAKAGVNYIEYSVSCGNLLDKDKFEAMRNKTFYSKLFSPGKKTFQQNDRRDDRSDEGVRIGPENEPKKCPCPTMLPDLWKMDNLIPSWRKYVDYKEKAKGQTIVFLAAFTRDKPESYDTPDQPGSGKPGIVYYTLKDHWIRE